MAYEISRNKGKITCDRKILISIINLATKEISGVSCMSYPLKNRLFNFLLRKVNDGVKIKFKENNNIIVDVYIKILAGYKVPDIAFRVQENIKNAITAMVDVNAAKININIIGVDFETTDETFVTA